MAPAVVISGRAALPRRYLRPDRSAAFIVQPNQSSADNSPSPGGEGRGEGDLFAAEVRGPDFLRSCFFILLAIATALTLTSCSALRTSQNPPAPADPKTYLASVSLELTKSWPANRTVNIVCHGHSVPAGYFRTPAVHTFEAYPYLLHRGLAERFPHAVINVIVTGIGGENSEQGAKRFRRDVLNLRPDVITIDYGLNDRSIDLARSERAWRRMIEMALARHIKVILLTPTPDLTAHLDDPNDPLNQHAQQIRRLAAEYHVGLVDSLALFEAKVRSGTPLKDLMAQSNHPNYQGHQIVAAALLNWFPLSAKQ